MTTELGSTNMDADPSHVVDAVYPPLGSNTSIASLDDYKRQYAASIADPNKFWDKLASTLLDWHVPYHTVLNGSLQAGDVSWFQGGRLNACYNCIDRHVNNGKGDHLAVIWEGDEPTDVKKFTFAELQRCVCQIANAMKHVGVTKGTVVTIYMPMIAELPMTLLACARIGAVHSVVFAGFSSEALAQRISAARSPFIVTADCGRRGGKVIALKQIVNDARTKLNCEALIEKVLVFERHYDAEAEEAPYATMPKDVRMDPLVAGQRPYLAPEWMDAEDPLFLLYTSGKICGVLCYVLLCSVVFVVVHCKIGESAACTNCCTFCSH
jgi:acetyl-CoA synthetase